MSTTTGASAQEASLRNIALIVHLLYASSLVLGFTSIVGVVIAYLKRGDAAGTIYESHLTYAIRTFWWSLLLGTVVLVTMLLLIGFVLAIPVAIWYIVRLVRPILAWADNKPIAKPTGFF